MLCTEFVNVYSNLIGRLLLYTHQWRQRSLHELIMRNNSIQFSHLDNFNLLLKTSVINYNNIGNKNFNNAEIEPGMKNKIIHDIYLLFT